jgi:hypothetical protein
MSELLPWLNLLLPLVLGYVVRIEHRVTRLEALREAESERIRNANVFVHRRVGDPS